MDEFELIHRFFERPVSVPGIVTGIGDDGAVLSPTAARDQVQVIDTLVEGVHFPVDTNPADIGYRAVAVNLSDIAAMGAQPRWMTLALTLPRADPGWVEEFANGLFDAANEFDVSLVGGDMTRGDQLVATVHMTADVEAGKALLRSGAEVGETIFVTGTLGDAAAGLALLGRKESDAFLIGRFLRPSARVDTGRRLVGRAGAAIDLSDGLVGDLSKLLDASGVGGVLDVDLLPLSAALKERFSEADRLDLALGGGDDYELCFTARAAHVEGIANVTAIGEVTEGAELVCRKGGVIMDYPGSGYRHFQ